MKFHLENNYIELDIEEGEVDILGFQIQWDMLQNVAIWAL